MCIRDSNNCSIRIGVNAGSLEKDILEKFKEPCPEALVESAQRNIKILEDKDFFNLKLVSNHQMYFYLLQHTGSYQRLQIILCILELQRQEVLFLVA